MLNGSTNAMSSKHRTNAIRNGIHAFASFSIGLFVIADATDRFIPIGGVSIPTARFAVITIPKCTGLIPTAFMITFINNRIIILLLVGQAQL